MRPTAGAETPPSGLALVHFIPGFLSAECEYWKVGEGNLRPPAPAGEFRFSISNTPRKWEIRRRIQWQLGTWLLWNELPGMHLAQMQPACDCIRFHPYASILEVFSYLCSQPM